MDYSVLKKRYYGIDLLRVISVFVVCMFHTTIHLGCDYGFLQGLIAVLLCASITPFMLTACKGSDEKKSDSVPARRIQ